MSRKALFVLLTVYTIGVQAQGTAQPRLTVNASYPRLEPLFQIHNQSAPLYEPFVFPMVNGELGMMIQGHCGDPCPWFTGSDSLHFFKRTAGGAWTDGRDATKPISGLDAPTTTFHNVETRSGAGTETQNYGTVLQTYTQITKGQYGIPAVVSDGTTLYMAYLRGVSDIYAGSIWWAHSTDNGKTWQDSTSPLLYGKYHSQHGPRGKEHVYSGTQYTSVWETEGFHSVTMAFRTEGTSTWAYIYGSYNHPGREANENSWGTDSYITYRIRIDKTAPGHLSTDRQLLYNHPTSGVVLETPQWRADMV